jgi:hypothetical protein
MTETRPTADLADALEARANDDDEFERQIVDGGGAVSTRAKQRTELDRAAASRLRSDAARIAELESALAWVGEVTPGRIDAGGVIVEMTPDEFNQMRAVLGKRPFTLAALGRRALGGEG